MFREGLQPSYSLICSGFEPFRPEEQLLSTEGHIFLITNLATPLGKDSSCYSLVSELILSESKLHPPIFAVRSTKVLV